VVDRIVGDCAESLGEVYRITVDLRPLKNGFLTANFGSAQPWQELLERNTPGRVPAGAPLLISQGQSDVIVQPAVNRRFRSAIAKTRRDSGIRQDSENRSHPVHQSDRTGCRALDKKSFSNEDPNE